MIKGGGCVVGRVDEEGELSGIRVAYLYPDFRTALVGSFSEGILERAQAAELKTVIEDRGVKVPIFTEPDGPGQWDLGIQLQGKTRIQPQLLLLI